MHIWASLVAQRLKRLPPMQETRVQSLGWEDPLEKDMATHSSTLAWRIPWTEDPGRPQSMGSQSGKVSSVIIRYVIYYRLPWWLRKCLPTMQETRVQSLGQEDPLEKEMATHSSTLAWRIPWREEPGRLQSMGSQRVGHD